MTRAIVGNCPCGETSLCMSVFASDAICLACTTVYTSVCIDGQPVLEPFDLELFLQCVVGGMPTFGGEV